LRNAEPELSETPTLPDIRTRLIGLENSQPRGDLGPPLGEGIQAGLKMT